MSKRAADDDKKVRLKGVDRDIEFTCKARVIEDGWTDYFSDWKTPFFEGKTWFRGTYLQLDSGEFDLWQLDSRYGDIRLAFEFVDDKHTKKSTIGYNDVCIPDVMETFGFKRRTFLRRKSFSYFHEGPIAGVSSWPRLCRHVLQWMESEVYGDLTKELKKNVSSAMRKLKKDIQRKARARGVKFAKLHYIMDPTGPRPFLIVHYRGKELERSLASVNELCNQNGIEQYSL